MKVGLRLYLDWAVVVVNWPACSPSTPMIWVRIPLTSTVSPVKFVFEKNENKQKEAGDGPFNKRLYLDSAINTPISKLFGLRRFYGVAKNINRTFLSAILFSTRKHYFWTYFFQALLLVAKYFSLLFSSIYGNDNCVLKESQINFTYGH